MAIKNCDELSNIIAVGLISGDDELAKDIANLAAKKRDSLVRAGKLKEGEEVDSLTGWTAHELELKANSADIELRAIVQAKILTGEIPNAEARAVLAKEITKTGGSISEGYELLERLRNAKVNDIQDIAKLWGGAYKNYPAKAVKEMEDAIAATISSNYSLRKYADFRSGEVSKLKTQLKNKEITKEQFDKEMKKVHKNVMDKIKKGENPKDFIPIDKEWDYIKKLHPTDMDARAKAWNQYVMARELIADGKVDDSILDAFEGLGATNLVGKISPDDIAKMGKDDLDKLLALAYTNTEQLYKDGALREAYRQKLIEVTSGMKVTKENIDKARSIMNTMSFAEKGASFADIVTADAASRAARKRGYKIGDPKNFYNSLKAFARKVGEDETKLAEPIVINGVEMKAIDVINIIYDITGDENILKLLRIGFYPDGLVLSIATSKLLGDSDTAAKSILRLFSKASEGNPVVNVRNLSLKAISGEEVPDGAKVGFFDFRKHLYSKDKLNRAKADLKDKLAEKNKMKIDSTDIEDLTMDTEDVDKIYNKLKAFKGKYIIVNDGSYKTNKAFSDALDKVNAEIKRTEDKITCIYPRGGMTSSFSMENGQLFFKTMDDGVFNRVAGEISIQSMGKAHPTREILASAFEVKTGKNGDKLRYQASYNKGATDSLGRKISDQQHTYFAQSQVVDENGKLIPVYHGTRSRFDTPVMEKGKVQVYGPGMYFSTRRFTAEYYSENGGGRITDLLFGWMKPKRVIEAYLDIRKPIEKGIFDREDSWIAQLSAIGYDIDDYTRKYLMDKEKDVYDKWFYLWMITDKEKRAKLAADFKSITGYDGVKAPQGAEETYWVPFTSNQIKYVDNRLPTEKPNMKYQERGTKATYDKGGQTLDGNKLSDQQVEHFKGAKSWEDGELKDGIVELYHGTANGRFDTFDSTKASPEGDWGAGFYSTNSINDVSRNYEGGGPDLENKISRRAEQIQYTRDISYEEAEKIAREELEGESALLTVYVKMTNPAVVGHTYLFDDITDDDELRDVLDLVRQKYDISNVEGDIMNVIYEAIGNGGMEIGEFKKRLGDVLLDSITDEEGNLVSNDIARLIIQGQGYDGIIDPTVSTKFKNMGLHEGTTHYIAFNENQYKFVDNLTPTDNPNMKFQLNPRGYGTFVSDGDSLKNLLDWGMDDEDVPKYFYDFVYNSLDRTTLKGLVDEFTMMPDLAKFDKLSFEEQYEIINRLLIWNSVFEAEDELFKIRNITKRHSKAEKLYNDSWDTTKELIKRVPYWGAIAEMKGNTTLEYFIRKFTDDGFMPYEAGIYTNADGDVLGSIMGTGTYNGTSPSFYKRMAKKGWKKYYHNHPNGSFFSVPDVSAFRDMMQHGVDSVGLILPGGVKLEFPLNKKTISLIEKYQQKSLPVSRAGDPSLFENSIYSAYLLSYELGIVDKQEWGMFDGTIKKIKGSGLTKVDYDNITFDVETALEDTKQQFIDALTPEGASNPAWQKRLDDYASQQDVASSDAVKAQMFTKDRTVEQIAKAYGVSTEFVRGTNMIAGVEAYGAYGDGVILFTDMVKESTAPHELFHAIFDMHVGKEQHDKLLKEGASLFNVSEDEIEEIMADSFAHWFNTGEFIYGDELIKIAEKSGAKKKLDKAQKSFIDKVLEVFNDLKRWLGLMDDHRTEVKQMFEDMVNMQYLPDAGKSVEATKAMIKYNDDLEKAAIRYYGQLLGDYQEELSPEYVERIRTKLSEKTGIDFKSFDSFLDKSALWKKVDEAMVVDKMVSGKFDKQIVNINELKSGIDNLTDKELEETILEDLGILGKGGTVVGRDNIDHIREAYLDYRSAENAVDSLTAKGKLVSLIHGGTAQTLSMDDIKSIFQNGTFAKKYKEMFYPNQELSPEDEQKLIAAINNNVFDTLSVQFAENLVRAGYSLPLINIKTFMYDYLKGNLDLNNKFVESFLYKNGIPFSSDGLRGLVDSFMPKEFKFNYEDSLFKNRFAEVEAPGEKSVFVENKNRFVMDSYSALAGIEKAGRVSLPANEERKILEDILTKYVDAVKKGVTEGTLDFQGAQGLKQEVGYALDMFEQDIFLPKYGIFLTPQERKELMGMKYDLPIGVKGQNITEVSKELDSIKEKLLAKYDRTLKDTAKNNEINASILKGTSSEDDEMKKAIEMRRNLLAEKGGVIREVNGQYLVYNAKEALEYALEDLPRSIGGLEGLRVLGKEGIEKLSNQQAYALLRYIEAAKSLDATAGYAMELMYKQNPMLLKCNFFEAYRIGDDGLPRALDGNLLNFDDLLTKLENTSKLDETCKVNIFEGVKNKFRKQGYVTTDDLDKIIDNGIKEAYATYKQSHLSASTIKKATNKMKNIYKKAFAPYTYLRDIPSGGNIGETSFRNIKEKVTTAMKQQYQQSIEDLESLGLAGMDGVQDKLYLTLPDGQKVSLRDAATLNADSWKKGIFNDESIFVAGADELGAAGKKTVEEQKEFRKAMVNEYDATLQTILNQSQFISESERALQGSIMGDVRAMLRRGGLTNMIVDALDAVSGINEEAARGIKDYLIGWKGNITFGKWKSSQIMERNELVKKAYSQYYAMELSKLDSVTPTTKAEDLALRLAKYFKTLERLLGSVDGLTGCTTSVQLNKAFSHIGEVVMNVDSVKGIFGLLSAVEQNQILKFFKFAKGELRKQADVFIRKGKGNFSESLGGYRDYAEEITGLTRDEFNVIFGSNLKEDEFKKALQGLTGFSLVGGITKPIMKLLNFLSGTNFIFRAAMSYPGQLLTIPIQSTAYFLKQIGFERDLGIDSLSDIDGVRMRYGILDGAYNEINWFTRKSTVSPDDVRVDSYYNRYGIPDVEGIYKATAIESSDDYVNMYAKINNQAASSISSTNKWLRQLDPYKDNANNIIDGLFARNFKNIAFQKAIRQNDFMQFSSAKAFMAFMEDPTVGGSIKQKLLDRVAAYSGRNFRNILGLGFGGIDRAVGGSGFGNIMYGLMQMFNFRGSWGQNIFKQAGAALKTGLKIVKMNPWMSKEGREAVARYIATQPEFMNFVGALFNDFKWAWRLQRFQDNGRWPDNEDMYITTEFGDVFDAYSAMDFIDYLTESLGITSQIYQGIQSFGPARPFMEARESAFHSYMDPTIYKDTYGIGAFFNSLGKNFGRQWKPHNWIAKAIGAGMTDGPEAFWTYVQNEWYKLSFGSVRYIINEDANSYGYTFEMTGQPGGIPSIFMGEGQMGGDKEFSYEIDNTETWETIKQVFNGDNSWDDRWTYVGNLGKTFVNGSQLFSLWKNAGKAINRDAPSYYTAQDLAEVLQNTDAGKEFYQKGYVTPKTPEEAEIFFNIMLENSKFRPGSSSFTKSIINYEDYGHMNGKEKGKEADAQMELWLDHMKHLTNEHGEFVKGKDGKKVDPSWEKLISEVRSGAYDQTYTTNLIYNYAKVWLSNHSSDPNYQLYIKLLGQGQAHNLIENTQDDIIKAWNAGKKGVDNKWNETEFENAGQKRAMLLAMGNSPIPGDNKSFFDKLQVLDEDDATVAALQIIKNQAKEGDRAVMERFFDVEENDDGSTSIKLRRQYEATLTQIGAVARAVDEGNLERAVAEASTLTNMYKNTDPTGAVTATLIDSVVNRIYDTDSFSPEQKQEAIIALFHHNKDFIQTHANQMRELLGDTYDEYANYMNQMLYQWDGALLSTLESMQTSGKGSSWTAKKTNATSDALKKLAAEIGNNGGARGTGTIGSTKAWVPVVIRGADLLNELGLKGYTPKGNPISIQSYTPHVDLSLKKDINRNVKGPKTQEISNKKQLSNLEKKATKALEAES